MNSFFKGLTRGLLAVIPICLIVCVLFSRTEADPD